MKKNDDGTITGTTYDPTNDVVANQSVLTLFNSLNKPVLWLCVDVQRRNHKGVFKNQNHSINSHVTAIFKQQLT